MAAQSFLLTRPATASARFAAALRESFGTATPILISPLMEPVFLQPALPEGPFDSLVLTSETGAEAARRISAERDGLPRRAFCVGDRTAQAALSAGFQAHSAHGDAEAMVRLIVAIRPQGRFLHLRGRDSTGNVVHHLEKDGIFAREAIVYDQQPRPLTPEAQDLLSRPQSVILPLFSPRSADLLARQGPFAAPLWIAALSPAVAERAKALHPEKLAVAAKPDAAALLRATEYLCSEGSRT